MTSFTELFQLENPRSKIVKALQGHGKNESLGAIIEQLDKRPDLKEDFLKLTPLDIHEILDKSLSIKRAKNKYPIVRVDEMDAYKNSIIAVLDSAGLHKDYGVSPMDIHDFLKMGSKNTLRTALKELSSAGLIDSVGVTKGLRYFVPALSKDANKIHDDLKAARAAKESAKNE